MSLFDAVGHSFSTVSIGGFVPVRAPVELLEPAPILRGIGFDVGHRAHDRCVEGAPLV